MADIPDSVGKVIDACKAAIDGNELRARPPKVMYHLTDGDGLHGILSNKTLWASLATAMNDALEVGYGLAIAASLLNDRLRKRPTGYDAALLSFLLDPSSVPPGIRYEMFPLVVSFCARCDRSGQWLHYGQRGRGVAIGFSSKLAKVVSYDLIRVDYSPTSQRARMLALINAGAKLVASEAHARTLSNATPDRLVLMTAHLVSLSVPQLAVRMKHPSFSDENEWRLVAHVLSLNGVRQDVTGERTGLKYRRSNQRVVPYEELRFRETPEVLKEIIVGYSSEIGLDAVKLLAQEQHVSPAIRRSDVPVR
jgi:Protein of unknown function (DUF2971)